MENKPIIGHLVFIESLGTDSQPFRDYVRSVENIKKLFKENRQWQSESKGSIKQFAKYFPEDPYLKEWVKLL